MAGSNLMKKHIAILLPARRYTQKEIKRFAVDPAYIALHGRLEDRFGCNGVAAVVIGKISGTRLDIILRLMSRRDLSAIYGYYSRRS